MFEYQQKQEQYPRNKMERLKLAQKFFADKGKTYSRAEFEIEFKAELERCSNIIS
ncbi:hypothetical protein P9J86_06980 [Glaesserella parasuis]|uniref:hypothetical protein n=1 Tax=Glaesserella parasuis TaxID=738 RepID=UPI0024365B2E|nr:hypothetical protein [Glaesserella parasuis]MDG6261633.1 hypothetical protein [Glaesserella parasuis]MDG6323054.1 hypothetical protein [Glaesserella parasuis]